MKVRFLIAFLWIVVTLGADAQILHSGAEVSNPTPKAISSTSSSAKPSNAKSATHVSASPAKSPIHFRDIARQAGLITVPRTSTERRYIVDTMSGGGVALFDRNNDGKLDIAVVNDSSIPTAPHERRRTGVECPNLDG